MSLSVRGVLRPLAAVAGLIVATALFADPPAAETKPPAAEPDPPEPLTVEEARTQARLLQRTYLSTLQMMHRRYFDEDERHPIPARTLEEVFEEVDAGTSRTSRWIAVNSPAMNVDHEPRPGFETDAVAELTAGKTEFERVDDGVYQRAGAVPLTGGCLKCHVSRLSSSVSRQRVAAFVITMPVSTP